MKPAAKTDADLKPALDQETAEMLAASTAPDLLQRIRASDMALIHQELPNESQRK